MEGSPTPLPKFSSYLARARALAPFECGGVSLCWCVWEPSAYTECGNVCGSQDLQTHFFVLFHVSLSSKRKLTFAKTIRYMYIAEACLTVALVPVRGQQVCWRERVRHAGETYLQPR